MDFRERTHLAPSRERRASTRRRSAPARAVQRNKPFVASSWSWEECFERRGSRIISKHLEAVMRRIDATQCKEHDPRIVAGDLTRRESGLIAEAPFMVEAKGEVQRIAAQLETEGSGRP